MKRNITILFLLLIVGSAYAGNSFELGFYNPKDSKSGIIIGYERVFNVDESVSLNLNNNFFFKEETKDRYIFQGNPLNSNLVLRELEFKTYYFPSTFGIKININETKPNLFIGGGIGWGLAWQSVYISKNILPLGLDETKFYNGFVWQINTGLEYSLSSRTVIYSKIFYNKNKLSRDREITDFGISWNEINMSGFGILFGLRIK